MRDVNLTSEADRWTEERLALDSEANTLRAAAVVVLYVVIGLGVFLWAVTEVLW